ncbi:MAG: glycerol kinase GlpK, partial [Paracoccaceae bacterium]
MNHILAIDQGTTSTRAIAFDSAMQPIASAQEEFTQHFPASGWVEHETDDIWRTVVSTCRKALKTAGLSASDIAGIGITNQRETTVVWDKDTGTTLHNAIVWQDRRTAPICAELDAMGHGPLVTKQTGLLLDPYFSATKLKWVLDEYPDARDRARQGKLLFGTVDSFLIWRLTNGAAHVTDATNASRTMLYDIHKGAWSAEICDLLDIPTGMLPEVRDCAADFGITHSDHFGTPIPILGVAGDQQAATLGQASFEPGMLKATYGTGCFALLNTGAEPITSHNRLLTTVAYQLDGVPTYAIEGSIFVAGAAVQWLRDGLSVIGDSKETQALAEMADPNQHLILVPAFTGLGAPYWNAETRGAVFGLTRNSGPAEFARATLESIGFQTRDLFEAMQADWPNEDVSPVLRVDGGLSANDWAMQFLSDILNAPVDRPKSVETTVLGAAWLAGMRAGLYPDQAGFAATWERERQFVPTMGDSARTERYAAWQSAVQSTISVNLPN